MNKCEIEANGRIGVVLIIVFDVIGSGVCTAVLVSILARIPLETEVVPMIVGVRLADINSVDIDGTVGDAVCVALVITEIEFSDGVVTISSPQVCALFVNVVVDVDVVFDRISLLLHETISHSLRFGAAMACIGGFDGIAADVVGGLLPSMNADRRSISLCKELRIIS